MALNSESGFVVLGSPPATGKTSTCIQLGLQLEDSGDRVLYFPLRQNETQSEIETRLANEVGIDLKRPTATSRDFQSKLDESSRLWVFIDEAQYAYDRKFDGLWTALAKQSNSWMPADARCIIATSYSHVAPESPVALKPLPHFPRDLPKDWALANAQDASAQPTDSLALTRDEIEKFFQIRAGDDQWLNWERAKQVLRTMCNGHVGVLRLGTDKLMKVVTKAGKETASEADAIDEFLTLDFAGDLKRCFASPTEISVEDRDSISNAILRSTMDEPTNLEELSEQDGSYKLWKCGVLTKSGKFTSPAARFFYYLSMFPERRGDLKEPENLDALVIACVKLLSASSLRYARDGDFPKEVAFQHLFNEAMNKELPKHVAIVPEIGTCADNATHPGRYVTGELDFYVNGKRHYKIELLRQGSDIGEHIQRFDVKTGKYRSLPKSDDPSSILVLDFRGPLNKRCPKDPLRCTLYFSSDFRTCEIQMREADSLITVSLRP